MAVVGATLRGLVERAGRVAGQRRALLIEGPTGAGKATLAWEIHAASARSAGPFVEVDCASISEALFDAHVFGGPGGSFRKGGGTAHVGEVLRADGGTVVFSSVDVAPAAAQEKLERLLQLREVWPPEGLAVRVDVCLIATAPVDLRAAVAAGTFRESLYHRLAVGRAVIPPLRDRRDEIVPLAEHFRELLGERFGRRRTGFSAAAAERLARGAWPGNVRQLENVVAHAIILGSGDEIAAEDLPGPTPDAA